jgi:hypothetical protein
MVVQSSKQYRVLSGCHIHGGRCEHASTSGKSEFYLKLLEVSLTSLVQIKHKFMKGLGLMGLMTT